MQKEFSGYRFINGILSPIINDNEIKEIDKAIDNAANRNINGAKTHLETALKKLSDRENPNYRISISESISAVESVVNSINGDKNGTLGKALNKINKTISLHPALQDGLKKIYAYTSDADGIRHGITDSDTCDYEDATYMLVSCSAFVNYLFAKADKAKIEIAA